MCLYTVAVTLGKSFNLVYELSYLLFMTFCVMTLCFTTN